MKAPAEDAITRSEHHLACEIGLILRRLRRTRGLTQKALAQQVPGGMEVTYIGKIERGEQLPSLKVLLRLSAALGVMISDFFYPPAGNAAEQMAPALHLEPLLQALRNRGIDGTALIRALLEAIGQHVLVVPSRATGKGELEHVTRADRRTIIPLPMPQEPREKS
jgi:transcriptional regulator with XRE-family HTH domain